MSDNPKSFKVVRDDPPVPIEPRRRLRIICEETVNSPAGPLRVFRVEERSEIRRLLGESRNDEPVTIK